MAKNPAFKFYASDFLTDTNTWEAIEVGIYIRLLCTQWVNGYIVKDMRRLSISCGVSQEEFEKAWVLVGFKFEIDTGIGWQNKKMEETRREKDSFIEKQRENGKKGGRGNKSDKNKANKNPSLSENESQKKPLEYELEKEIELEEEDKGGVGGSNFFTPYADVSRGKVIPEIEEVEFFFAGQRKSKEAAHEFYNYQTARNWEMGAFGTPIHSWRHLAMNWKDTAGAASPASQNPTQKQSKFEINARANQSAKDLRRAERAAERGGPGSE